MDSYNKTRPGLIGLMDDVTISFFVLICVVIIGGVINIAGLIFNIINIIVFIKMGFNSTINISLLSLATADIGIHITMLGYVVIYSPEMTQDKSNIELIHAVGYIVLGCPHVMFSRISGCLTAFISLERFLCIAVPLKVKALITPKRTAMVSCAIYSFMFCNMILALFANKIGPKFNKEMNVTVVGLVANENSYVIQNVSLGTSNVIELAVFALVVIFTVGLIQKFVDISKWRKQVSSVNKKRSMSSRDKVLVKMVLSISAVFIVCLLPEVAGTIAILCEPDYSVKGKQINIFIASFSLFFNITSLNSSIRFFIYMKMSSKFQQVFWSLMSESDAVNNII